jgi:hypothetical protein
LNLLRTKVSWTYRVVTKLWQGICTWTEVSVSTTKPSDEMLGMVDELLKLVDEIPNSREKVLLIHSLFRSRNIHTLQRVYEWHISKLNNRDTAKNDRDELILYVLAGLSDIGMKKNLFSSFFCPIIII